MPLTEIQIRQAKPKEKTFSLGDGRGLILEVRPNGSKLWVARLWEKGSADPTTGKRRSKEFRRGLGSYPEISLKAAREKNFELRMKSYTTDIRNKDSVLFSDTAEEWMKVRILPRLAPSYVRVIRIRLDRWILPEFEGLTLGEVSSKRILDLCRRIGQRGTYETASRVKQLIGQVFRYAVAVGVADGDPTAALAGALTPSPGKHRAAITDEREIGELMRRIAGYPYPVMRCALLFSALTFCRPGEIRHAEWGEIDLEKREWRIGAEKMKMRRPHIVPLCEEAVDVLKELREHTGKQRWLFPSPRRDGRPMSENGVRVALRSLGYSNDDMCAHGFRAMASTALNENGWPVDVIERQLAHVERNSVRKAYNHAEYLPQRREMMAWWGRYLEGKRQN